MIKIICKKYQSKSTRCFFTLKQIKNISILICSVFQQVFETDLSIGVSVQQFVFNTEIYSRYIKIVPLEYTDACLKLEIIGCPKQGKSTRIYLESFIRYN